MTRVAVVTGASSGVGRAVAVAFGTLGWSVGIGARRRDALAETAGLVAEAGGRCLAHPLDVSDADSVDRFFGAVETALGPVDTVVNNAGTARPGDTTALGPDVHRMIVETNLLGAILVTRRALGAMRERTATTGDIVFISSDSTVHLRPGLATYLATKAGLEAFAATVALECEGTGIRSSVLRLGPTLTGFADEWDLEVFTELMPRWHRFGVQRHFATLEPADVADAVVRMVTAPAHSWVPILELQPNPPREG
ncbi:MAG: SDR family oxidoreductase [Actinomycetota bacterium]